MTGRDVRRARKIIARESCPARWGIRHRWTPLSGIWGGLFVKCRNCGDVA